MRLAVPVLLMTACGAPPDSSGSARTPEVPAVADFQQVVPSAGLPPEVAPQQANNNLDVAWFDGRLFLAFRTAPTHFASADAEMIVVSSTDEQSWQLEGRFQMGTDLREPQLVPWGGELNLYMAVLGTNPLAFEPQGTVFSRRIASGAWTEPTWQDLDTMIPWRIKEIDGRLHLFGYTGGENVYEVDGEPIAIHWLVSDDAVTWEPAVPEQEVVLTGGGSETDAVFLDDGSLVAVVRNEAGDEQGFGSRICSAPAEALGSWTCVNDPKKYDSPLLFRWDGRLWLVARRHLTEDGHYDLGLDDLPLPEQYIQYQAAYWQAPKRCALWQVDPDALTVSWALDLPSKGDTCFPEMVEVDGFPVVYNYSSDPDQESDPAWYEGQVAPTQIYRQVLLLP